jgi:site-specific DNA-methyltransferase (adenine-specific)
MRKLLKGDCLERLKELPDGSIDCVIADPPYGTTACKWDSIIPLDAMWAELLRVCKPSAAICLFAGQPFTSALVMSRPKLWRHEWVWIKNRGGNFANTVREPMKEHDTVQVFSRGKWTYHKQMQGRTGSGKDRVAYVFSGRSRMPQTEVYRNFAGDDEIQNASPLRVPSSWQKFNIEIGKHPTQKPVDLCAYLVRTYTDPGETVLDFCMGSGTTGVAAIREGRDFVGIERDEGYYATARERILAEVARLTETAAD